MDSTAKKGRFQGGEGKKARRASLGSRRKHEWGSGREKNESEEGLFRDVLNRT